MGSEEIYELARQVKKEGKLVGVFTDLDDTVLVSKTPENGFAPGDDPQNVAILPKAAEALKEIIIAGGIVGVITNRGGREAAHFLKTQGVTAAHIIGTYGWESYRIEDRNGKDTVRINERFKAYAKDITNSLRKIRNRIYDQFGDPIRDDGATIVIPMHREELSVIKQEPLLIQVKAVADAEGFPLGLSNIYNLNLISPDSGFRKKVITTLEDSYEALPGLQEVWGKGGNTGNADTFHRYTIGFEPCIKEGKAYAMAQMVKKIESFEIEKGSAKKIGLIIYSGDSNPDAAAMKKARELEINRNRELRSIGIWVDGNGEQPEVQAISDIHVDSPSENAEILAGLARALKE